jgi:predicted porin
MFYGGAGDVIPGHGNFAAMQQVPRQAWGFGGGYFSTYNYRLDNANDKMVYYTPRVGGLQIGLAYTPDDKGALGLFADPSSGVAEESGGAFNIANNGGQSEVKTIGANYLRRLGPVEMALFGTYSAGDAELQGGEDSSAWGFGSQFAYGGFAAGGSFLRIRDIGGLPGRDRNEWELGGSYVTGPWTIGLSYARIEQDGHPLTTFASDDADYYGLGITFSIGPGISIAGGLQHYDYQSGTNAAGLKSAPDGAHTILLFGTAVSF